jgi:Flp pilus assembly pilin Flp
MPARVRTLIAPLYRDEEGASLVEYILLAVLIGVAAIAGLTFLGRSANNRMNNIGSTVQNQPS